MRAFWILAGTMGCVEYDPSAALLPEGPPTEGELEEGHALDTFEGGVQSTVDVIVYGDTSGSMDEELQTLGQTITPFVERLATFVDDWQLAAVTSGSGCVAGRVLRPETPDFADDFADALVEPIGDDSEAEQGLRNVARVMENNDRDCNDGLVRGGSLQILFVSDENEESPGYSDAPDYWLEYLDRIHTAHGDPSRIKISAVAGPTPQGCRGADPGFGYDGPVAATGGEYLSICDDWADQIDLVADTVALRNTFPLSQTPIASSIRVWVNETQIESSAFTYDAALNIVTLLTPAGASDAVAIEYQIAE